MRKLHLAALAALAVAGLLAGCITVNNNVNQFNGDSAIEAARTNQVAPAAYSRSLTTLTTTNGVASTEITAGGGIVNNIAVNSAKTTDPATTIPVSLTK